MAAADLDRLHAELDRLDSHLHQVGAPPPPPGLSDEQIAEYTAPLPLPLPAELLAFYGRQDGFGAWQAPMPHAPISLHDGVKWTLLARDDAVKGRESGLDIDPGVVWPRSWFMAGASSVYGIVFDCAVPSGELSPVLNPEPTELDDSYPDVVASSFAEVITIWNELFDTGFYGYDPATRSPRRGNTMPDHYSLQAQRDLLTPTSDERKPTADGAYVLP
jgi:hypothetical protein